MNVRGLDQATGHRTSAYRCTLRGRSIHKHALQPWRRGDWTRQCLRTPRQGRARVFSGIPRQRQERNGNRNNYGNAEPSTRNEALFQTDSPEMRFLSQGLVGDVVGCETKPVNANQDVVGGQLRRVLVQHQHRRNPRFRIAGNPRHSECQITVGHSQVRNHKDQLMINAGWCQQTP